MLVFNIHFGNGFSIICKISKNSKVKSIYVTKLVCTNYIRSKANFCNAVNRLWFKCYYVVYPSTI